MNFKTESFCIGNIEAVWRLTYLIADLILDCTILLEYTFVAVIS